MSEESAQPTTRRAFSPGGCVVWIAAAIMFVVFLAALLPNIAASYPGLPVLSQFVATPQTAYSTSAPVPAQQQPRDQQPASAPVQGAAPWPTLTPTAAEIQPALTIPPAPTATAGFWTPEEQTQIAATATAFIEVVPTAPPAFAEYTDEKCRDPELVAESATLQLFCKK